MYSFDNELLLMTMFSLLIHHAFGGIFIPDNCSECRYQSLNFLIAAFYMEPKSEKITCKLWHVAGNISKM